MIGSCKRTIQLAITTAVNPYCAAKYSEGIKIAACTILEKKMSFGCPFDKVTTPLISLKITLSARTKPHNAISKSASAHLLPNKILRTTSPYIKIPAPSGITRIPIIFKNLKYKFLYSS